MQVQCWPMLILNQVMLILTHAQVVLGRAAPSAGASQPVLRYVEPWTSSWASGAFHGPAPKLINVFAIFQPLWNSELKGQASIHGRGLHYFKNLSGNTTLITTGLTQWVSSSETKNTMKHFFMIMTDHTLYFHTCHFVRLTKSWLKHHLLGIFSIYRTARLTNRSSKHHFLTFQELGLVNWKSFVFCGEKWTLPPLLEGHLCIHLYIYSTVLKKTCLQWLSLRYFKDSSSHLNCLKCSATPQAL